MKTFAHQVKSVLPAAPRVLALTVLATALSACSMFGKDKPKPADLGPNPGKIAVHQAWTAKVGGEVPLAMPVAVQGNTVAVVAKDGTVTVLDAVTGAQTAKFSAGEPLTTGVGSDGQRAVVVTRSNQLVAFEGDKQIWKRELSAATYTPPLVAGGRVFLMAADRSLSAFDARTGRELWSAEGPSNEPLILRQPGVLMAVGNTLVAGVSGRLAGVDPDTGSVRWQAPLASPRGTNDVERLVDLVGSVSRVGASVCARAFQAAVGCVDTSNGTVRWTQTSKGSDGIGGDEQSVFGAESNGTVQAWRREDGSRLWSIDKLQYRKLTAPLVLGRSVVLADDLGTVHLLSREDGSALTRLETDKAGVATAPVVAGNTLVVVSRSGTVYGFKPD
ncbi:MAG: outer membrane protein assembly factor BamB [Comamonas sp.]|uniref:outer membrane protein assembly factor BamB n=1 Tax=unclassified Comamonas TaxID=2638500 RepID=UPI000EAD4DBC|nr:outer membrane protein assembly factor BamB [Comamonas sp. lk]